MNPEKMAALRRIAQAYRRMFAAAAQGNDDASLDDAEKDLLSEFVRLANGVRVTGGPANALPPEMADALATDAQRVSLAFTLRDEDALIIALRNLRTTTDAIETERSN